MLKDVGVVVDATWAATSTASSTREPSKSHEAHRIIDRELRRIAKRRAALDVDEARWLREAERHRVWRTLGFSTALEYLEDVFGYGPRTAKDRLRVARELGDLPELEAEMSCGALPYSAARELTRVMTRATQAAWLAKARGKNVRDIELLVAGHKKGDTPDDPKDPSLITRRVVLELDARRHALLQQVRATLETERGEHLDDAALVEAMCMHVLVGDDCSRAERAETRSSKAPRPAHQIVIRRCEDCTRVWQQARGAFVEIPKANLERAACDAETVREPDLVAAQATGKRRPAPTLSIPAKTRDLVTARDQGRCRFPGCRAARNVEIHHIVHRAHGGGHEASNLLLLCDGHHTLLHDGVITISGRAPDELVFTRDGRRVLDSRSPAECRATVELHEVTTSRSRFDDVVKLEHATQALRQLGFKTREARRALEQARAHVGTDADVPALVRAVLALQRTGALAATVSLDAAHDNVALASQALVQAGFSRPIATRAVEAARAHVGTDIELDALIREALRHCR